MKALLLLFGIYLLALGCLPCADDACTTQSTIVAVETTHSKECHGEEICPPFCTCSCCSIHISAATTVTFSVPPYQQAVTNTKGVVRPQPLLSRASNSIWQPPRLG